MKKWIAMFVAVAALVTLSACGGANSKTAAEKAKQTEAAGKNFLHVITTNDWQTKVKNKASQIIYVGRPTCEDCQAFQPMFQKEVKKQKLGKIDYYNVDKARKVDEKAMTALLKKYDIDSVPTLVAMKDGKVKATYSPTPDKKKLADWLKKHK
ncbi:thioredoxin family protein [Listeria grayi]|uniref:thioredoxin family protein n=1 Tax=Listeria grayi TaxID=1641 RepID=UPI0016243490|nr:thioredoxin family protein [Listeria grayi]MBC1922355.1 thioredoxin family protein [Listeria grayi]